jgi:cytochrome P450
MIESSLPPGSDLPMARQTARMVMRPLRFMEELRARFGDVFTVRLLGEAPWVMVSDPALIKQVFKAPANVLHAGEVKQVLKPVLGSDSVLLLDEDRHMRQRKLLLPLFSGGHIEGYEKSMRTAAERAIETWPKGRAEPAVAWTRAIALEVILRTVFGVPRDSERFGALHTALSDLRLPSNARESRAATFRSAIERVDSLIFAEIRSRSENGGTKGHDDVLSLLVQAQHEDGSAMASSEIRDELMSLLVAGYETTATTLAWALERLARNPQALAVASEEGRAGGGPYIEAVLKETLRLRPALPLVGRAVKAPFNLEEHSIPPGTTIMPAILLLHHRPDIYPDPTSFRPERFLGGPPDPHAWIPFGGGVRRCIGARFALHEMRVVLATLLEHAEVRAVEQRPEAMRRRDVTLSPSLGARIILEAR